MVIDAPVHGGYQDVVAGFGRLGNQRLDFGQAHSFSTVFTRQVHHDQKLAPTLVQRQHLELVAGRQHTGPHHRVADHRVEQLAALHAFVLAVGGVFDRQGLHQRFALAAWRERYRGIGIQQARRFGHGPGLGGSRFAAKPTEQRHGLLSTGRRQKNPN